MGLDMYLNRARRINNATIKDIYIAEEYMDYLLRPSKFKNTSMKKYCGVDKSKVNINVVDDYLKEYKTRYQEWDTEKKYGHLGLWEGIGYWRKANHIHNWFVKYVQNEVDDCGVYEVSEDALLELLETCKKVKYESKLVKGKVKNGEQLVNGKWKDIIEDGEYIEDPSVAKLLLPTTSGFFFGSCNYDKWYLDGVNYTIDLIKKVLKETDFENEIVTYHASW